MADLTTSWLGMTSRSPLVVAASPLSGDAEAIAAAVSAGAGAVVMHSLFEEQLVAEQMAALGGLREVFLTLFPDGLVLTPEWAQDDSGNGRRSQLRKRRGSDPNASFPVLPETAESGAPKARSDWRIRLRCDPNGI